MEAVDNGFSGQDISIIRESASDSINVYVKVKGHDAQYHNYDKESYLTLLEENWKRVKNYSYKKIGSDIEILNQKKAIVKEKVLEKFVMDKNNYSVLSDVVVEIELVNGRLVATQISAEFSLQVNEDDRGKMGMP